jgi:D-glycero-D-manno-heptose 1,7-bisphosphate phosphatase
MKAEPASDKVVILDRDGTIIVDRHYLSDPAELELLPNAADGLRYLSQRGYRLVVITNQSGVGRGMFSLRRLDEINARFSDMLRAIGVQIEQIYCCPHAPQALCNCRKPNLGLLARAAFELQFNPRDAIVIGDKPTDIEFGRRARATTILIATNPGVSSNEPAPDFVATDLLDAAHKIGTSASPHFVK